MVESAGCRFYRIYHLRNFGQVSRLIGSVSLCITPPRIGRCANTCSDPSSFASLRADSCCACACGHDSHLLDNGDGDEFGASVDNGGVRLHAIVRGVSSGGAHRLGFGV